MSETPVGRLPVRVKAGYAAAELGISAVELLLQVYLLIYYNTVVGLNASLAGLALAVAILWDAISDPIMGNISDHTRSRLGRRRAYFLPGALGFALTLILIFNPPTLDSQWTKFLFLLFSYTLLNTASTVLAIPHATLSAELTFDRDDRTGVYAFRLLFNTIGLLLGMSLPAILAAQFGGEANPRSTAQATGLSAIYLAVPIVASTLVSFLATRGRDTSPPPLAGPRSFDFFANTLASFKNPFFRVLLVAFVIATVGRALNTSIALYYYEHRLGLSQQTTVAYVLLPFFAFILLSIPLWVWLSRRVGKKWPAFAGVLALGLMTMFSYPFFPPGSLAGPLFAAFFGGLLGGSIILLDSFVADVVDYDELKSGQNREGVYFGVWRMATKFSRALGIGVAGLALDGIGFQAEAAVQSQGVQTGLAWLFGPGVGLFFILGAAAFALLPLSDAVHKRIQALLVRRRQQRDARRNVASSKKD